MKYECPTCNELDHDLERAYAERDALRAEPASRCLCAAYDDGWMDCTAHTKHCGVEVNEDWLCVVCGINVQIHGRSDDELRRLGQGDVRRPQRDGDR